MKTVVITGSTKGIGYGLAVEMLKQGCNVVVSGRRQKDVDGVVKKLIENYDASRILGVACDVSEYAQVQALWNQSKEHFRKIDIWINNAGQAQAIQDFWEIPVDLIDAVVQTNILGQMYGVKVAVNGMLAQGEGALYIMEGKGARGDVQKGMTLYSTTKRAGNYLFNALVKELEGTSVLVGSLSPGMVVTGLLTREREAAPENWERTKRIFNILADKVETVTPWLVEEILKNRQHGVEIRWLTRGKVLWRFLTAGLNRRDLFAEEEREAV